jgi:uncharacterized protein (TIGR02001 family)
LKGKLSFEIKEQQQTNKQTTMNKSIIALSVAALGVASIAKAALPLDDISVSTTFGYESEYVFRGEKLDQQAFQPSIDVEYGNFYAGIWGSYGISNNRTGRETDFYAGYAFALDDQITLDFGATYYYYSNDVPYDFELYAGAAWDVFLEPAGYIYFETENQVWTFELSGGYSIDVADQTTIDFSGHAGYQYNYNRDTAAGEPRNGWYAGIAADLTYAFTDNASFSIGPRLTSKKEDSVSSQQLLWWGAAFTAGF